MKSIHGWSKTKSIVETFGVFLEMHHSSGDRWSTKCIVSTGLLILYISVNPSPSLVSFHAKQTLTTQQIIVVRKSLQVVFLILLSLSVAIHYIGLTCCLRVDLL